MWFNNKKNIVFVFNRSSDEFNLKDTKDIKIVFCGCGSNKWKTIGEIFDKHKLKNYKTISFIDSDVQIDTEDLEKFLYLFKKHNLNYASPSYSNHAFFSERYSLRIVNFIPDKFITFNFKSLNLVRKYFDENDSGSGIDWLIPKMLKYKGTAIIGTICIGNNYSDNENINVRDLLEIYSKFNFDSLNYKELSRIEYDLEEVKISNNVEKFDKMKFSRPSRRSNGCGGSEVQLSSRLLSENK
jgi:hypothetical protein